MNKYCSIDNCENPLYGHGYCFYHYKMYKVKPIKVQPYKISKFSHKREVQAKEYIKQITVSNALPNQRCFFCDKIVYGTISNHHLEGREDDKLLDTSLLVPTHNTCHLDFHQKSVHILCKNLWWEGFLQRLKEKSEKEYEKVLYKFNKK